MYLFLVYRGTSITGQRSMLRIMGTRYLLCFIYSSISTIAVWYYCKYLTANADADVINLHGKWVMSRS